MGKQKNSSRTRFPNHYISNLYIAVVRCGKAASQLIDRLSRFHHSLLDSFHQCNLFSASSRILTAYGTFAGAQASVINPRPHSPFAHRQKLRLSRLLYHRVGLPNGPDSSVSYCPCHPSASRFNRRRRSSAPNSSPCSFMNSRYNAGTASFTNLLSMLEANSCSRCMIYRSSSPPVEPCITSPAPATCKPCALTQARGSHSCLVCNSARVDLYSPAPLAFHSSQQTCP
jgi:hypothetical protein